VEEVGGVDAAGPTDNGGPGPPPYVPGYFSAYLLDHGGIMSRPSTTLQAAV
jgi:hypothetical protein